MSDKGSKPGQGLERQVADAYRAMGARKVEHNCELAGNQIDVYVEMESPDRGLHRIAVEVKDWRRPVGIDVVNKFALVIENLRNAKLVDEGVIVSASGFSKQARNAAETYGIRLLELADLVAIESGQVTSKQYATLVGDVTGPVHTGQGDIVIYSGGAQPPPPHAPDYSPDTGPRIRQAMEITFNPFTASEDENVRRLSARLAELANHVTTQYLRYSSNRWPEFTFHNEAHSNRVGEYIEQLVRLPCYEPVNVTELFLLLAGAWTHDLGFVVGARESHNEESSKRIKDDDVVGALLGSQAAIDVVAELAYNHSSSVPVAAIPNRVPWVRVSDDLKAEPVRLKFICCLLRLADALDIDERRAIAREEVLKELPEVSRSYHYCHLRITHIRVDKDLCQVVVQGLVKDARDRQKVRWFIEKRLKLGQEVRDVALPIQRYITGFRDTLNYEIDMSDTVRERLPECVSYEFVSPTPTYLELFENWKRLHRQLDGLLSMFTDGPYREIECALREAKEGKSVDWNRVRYVWENCKQSTYLPTLKLVQKARWPEPPLQALKKVGDRVEDSLSKHSFPDAFDALREFRAVLAVEFSKVDEELQRIGSEVLASH
ncbi:MAG: restriction endonuclease [Anaerolineae bacterium]